MSSREHRDWILIGTLREISRNIPRFDLGRLGFWNLLGAGAFALGGGFGGLETVVWATNAEIPYASGADPNANYRKDSWRTIGDRQDDQSKNELKFEKCDQECLYQKANENISLQINYIWNKMHALDSKGYSSLEKLAVLGNTCSPREKEQVQSNPSSADAQDALDSCQDRFEKVRKLWFAKARNALGTNQISEQKLGCARFSSDGKCIQWNQQADQKARHVEVLAPRQSAGAPPVQKYSQLPYFSTFDELMNWAKKNPSRLQQVQSDMEWAQQFDELAPTEGGFQQFKGDDSLSTGSSRRQIYAPKDEKGNPRSSKKAFKAAQETFQELRASIQGQVPSPLPSLSVNSLGGVMHQSAASATGPTPRPSASVVIFYDVHQDIFNQARGQLIDSVNQSNGEWAQSRKKEVQFVGKKGNQDPQQKPLEEKTYTGKETVNLTPSHDKGADTIRSKLTIGFSPDQLEYRPNPQSIQPASSQKSPEDESRLGEFFDFRE